MVRLLIGGSPCTHWSIAQKNNRETTAEGIGWELFKNYLIAKEKFKPDFFLYENNKSMAKPIKEQITYEFGVEPILINSALVSAQNRQRFYWNNIPNVKQPEDRGILLRDILESGVVDREKAHYLKHQAGNARDYFKKHHTQIACEPVAVDLQVVGRKKNEHGEWERAWEARTDGKSSNLTSVESRRMIAEPVRVGCYPSPNGTIKNSQGMRLYSVDGKAVNLTANGGGMGAKTGLYAIPVEFADGIPLKAVSLADGKEYTVYEVRNGLITIKDKQYPIKLTDGYYIIRKLTVTECCRLQTMPDDYCRAVSATQGYKGLGNGWTAEVIIHILKHAKIPLDEHIEVLSMYDGIGTGRYCLDKMGYSNITYHAYEIDKYPMAIANDNYPDIIQCGDAFQVRNDDWRYS